MFETFEIIKYLAKKRGISLNDIEEALGYGRNTLYKLKSSPPNAQRLLEIADYFNVSVDYLLGRDVPEWVSTKDMVDLRLFLENAAVFGYDGVPLNEEQNEKLKQALTLVFFEELKNEKQNSNASKNASNRTRHK